MGYLIYQLGTNFFLPEHHREAALKSLQSLCMEDKRLLLGGGSRPPKRAPKNYPFVDGSVVLGVSSLEAALREWRWTPIMDDEGNIEDIEFLGQKLGNEDELFNTIAPFVRAGSYIVVAGEEGEVWRWRFDGERCHREAGRIEF